MAVLSPHLQKEWEERRLGRSWNKRIPWRQRMMRWAQVSDGGKDTEEEDDNSEETMSEDKEEESTERVLESGGARVRPVGGGGDQRGDVDVEGGAVGSRQEGHEKVLEKRMDGEEVEGEEIRTGCDSWLKADETFDRAMEDSQGREDEEEVSERMDGCEEEEDGEEESNIEELQTEYEQSFRADETFGRALEDNLGEGGEEEAEAQTESGSSHREDESSEGRMEDHPEEEDEEMQGDQLDLENPSRDRRRGSEDNEMETDEVSSGGSSPDTGLESEHVSAKLDDLNGASGTWTSPESAQSEQLLEDETITSESWTTGEDFDDEDLQEEEFEEEVEDEFLEELDEDEDEETKIYSKDCHPVEVFASLNEFRKLSVLTDLTLTTDGGRTFNVHSVVLAAVSSLVCKVLTKNLCCCWSRTLDPEVEDVGLEAIVEFAYTGSIPNLNGENLDQIRTAARSLGASRVVTICDENEEAVLNGAEDNERKRSLSSSQQLIISLQFVRQLWENRLGCDAILNPVGASVNVHRAVLAVSSDYFRSMFTLGMKESQQRRVSLPYVLSSELQVLISSSYSGELLLSWGSVYELTSTALQLQYQPALGLCLDFLRLELDPRTCLDVGSFAEAFEVPQLLQAADDYVLRQFQKVASTPKFKDLPPKQLMRYLRSHALCVSSELVVFDAVVTWIQAKPKARLRLARSLMRTIHFPLMTFKEFKEVRNHIIWSEYSLKPLFATIFQVFCSNDTHLGNQCRVYLPKECLVLIGGDQITDDLSGRSISKELWFGNSLKSHTGFKKAMEWRRLDEMPDAKFSHELAVLDGKLYVIGGKKYYGNRDMLNCVYRFDPLLCSWERRADMLEKRSFFSVVVLDDKIYAIGGSSDPEYSNTVERYCPTTNSWSFTWPLDLPLSGHVAKVLQGHVFVSGGRNDDYLSLSSMFLYHPETGSTYLATMSRPRAHHCMEILGENLYVAGGVTTINDSTVGDLLECEMYDPNTDVWTPFTSLPVPRVGAGSVVMEGKFYMLGGYSQEDYSDTKTVHRYDSAAQRWENVGKMPGPNNDLRACLLGLPQHLRS